MYLDKTHGHAADVDSRSIRNHFVFSELSKAFVEEEDTGSNAQEQTAGWIRTAHGFRKC